MLNRVDFKGCCEKQELKERVERLWLDHVAALREFIGLCYKNDLFKLKILCSVRKIAD